jgi:hypothetical protein
MLLSFVAAVLISAQGKPIPELDRGSNLYKNCQAVIRIQDAGDAAATSDYKWAMACIAYIDGFVDGLAIAGSKAVCSDGASLQTMARVYINWMERHPKYMDSEKVTGLAEAVLDAYPCPMPKK